MASPSWVGQGRTEAEALVERGRYRRGAWECLAAFLPLLRPHRGRVLVICLVDLLQIVVNLLPPLFAARLMDDGLIPRNAAAAWQFFLLFAACQLAVQGGIYLRNILLNHLQIRVMLELRQKLFIHLQRVSVAYLESSPIGQRVFRLRIDTETVANAVVGFWPAVMRFVEFAFIALAITALDPVITAVSLGFLLPYTVLLLMATSAYRVLDRRRLLWAEHRDSGLLQGISSFDLIKSFARQRWELSRHASRSVKTQRIANQHYTLWWLVDFFGARTLTYGRTATVTFLAYQKVVQGAMTLGETIPMIAFVLRIGEPITAIVDFINNLRRSMIGAERCIQILEVKSAVPESPSAKAVADFSGRMELQEARFSHLDGTEVIKGVSAEFSPGSFTAIVGGSGAGKSTLAALLLRLHDPSSGRVLADRMDLRDLNRHHLYQRFAVVTQEAFVFMGSLADNLRVGRDDATDEQMIRALGQVGLSEWLAGLPRGLETDLESGGALSVGQRQRIGIARALLADPKVLVLDEPTSALDSQTEEDVMKAILEAARGRTTILITHRLNTAGQADRVLVMDDGRIVEEGPPADLAAGSGPYARLLTAFFGASR